MATEMQEKPGLDVEVSNVNTETNDFHRAENGEQSHSTGTDVRHMQRMGRNQQLVRNFRLLSIASFTAIATAAWELAMFLITPALTDGGLSGLMYSNLWAFALFGPVYLSLAEMASMAPIAGAQYHWVSEFAPERFQRILSYITGWTSTLAWQGGNALGVFVVGTLIQAMITVKNPDYPAPAWQGTLLVIGATLVAFVGCVYGSRFLHTWQNAVFVVHVGLFFVLIIPIWVKAPSVSHQAVWNSFENNGGWSSMTLSILAGQLTALSGQVGIDTAAHMSEEVKDAARQVPKAMIMVYLVNMALILVTFITLAYHIPSVTDALNDPTLYPAIYVLRQAWSPNGVVAVLVLTCVVLIASNIVYLAAVTRDLFAFARDQGLPFSNWMARVDKKRAIPVNAAIATCVFSVLLSLIYLGSPVAFYAITSLCTVALLQCYMVSIGCMLWRRICLPETLPPAQFPLGRWGIPINVLGLFGSAWSFFWCFWPQYTPVSASDFNWASALFIATIMVAMIHFVFKARKVYKGPVALVEGRKVQ